MAAKKKKTTKPYGNKTKFVLGLSRDLSAKQVVEEFVLTPGAMAPAIRNDAAARPGELEPQLLVADLDLSVLPYRFGTHSGWLEAATAHDPTYSQSTRVAPSFASASSALRSAALALASAFSARSCTRRSTSAAIASSAAARSIPGFAS